MAGGHEVAQRSGREPWRLLELSTDDPAMNLAIDEAIIRARTAGEVPPTLRLWQNPPCIVIGVSQNPNQEVSLPACNERGLPVLRRQSGGGAVYHDSGNLNYSLVVDHKHLAGNTATERSYAFFLRGVIAALSSFGVDAHLRHISDVYVGDRKIAGCAQYRTNAAILHHGCVLVSADLRSLEHTLRVPAAWYREVVNLIEIAQSKPGIADLGNSLVSAFGNLFDVILEPAVLSESEWARAKQLSADKYGLREWNLREPPGWKPGRYGPRQKPSSNGPPTI